MIKKLILLILLLTISGAQATVLLKSLDEPQVSVGLSDNGVIDIIKHKGSIWLATSGGLSYTDDDGQSWNIYNTTNGLVSQEISAFYSAGDEIADKIWVATNHSEEIGGQLYAIADGLSYSDDEGRTWDTMMVKGSYGGQSVIYDITGVDSVIFCASWAGGLFGSFDGGQTWRDFYASAADSINRNDPTVARRTSDIYFSAVVDTFHQDSLILWAGTASGLMKYVWAPDYAKPSSNNILDIFKADTFYIICGDRGLSRYSGLGMANTFNSAYSPDDGLPGPTVTTGHFYGDKVFVGTRESLTGPGTGLAVSADMGRSFTEINDPALDVKDTDKYVTDIADLNGALYVAAKRGGLARSIDMGLSWEAVVIDTGGPLEDLNRETVNSLVPDTANNRLWLGTDAGLVMLQFDGSNVLDSTFYYVFPDDDTSGARTHKVDIQHFYGDDEVVDSIYIWALNSPLDEEVGSNAVYISFDEGASWYTRYVSPMDTLYYDIAFLDDYVALGGQNLLNQIIDLETWIWGTSPGYQIQDSLNPITLNFRNRDFWVIEIIDSIIFLGTDGGGFGVSPPSQGSTVHWGIHKANTNPIAPDKVTPVVYPNLTGNWVTALGIQELPGGEQLLWATGRPVATGLTGEANGISFLDLHSENVWRTAYTGTVAWNFGFYDSTVFAATSAGLLYSSLDTNVFGDIVWDTARISGQLVSNRPRVEFTIDISSSIYGAKVIDDQLWVGTEDGAAVIPVDLFETGSWDIFRTEAILDSYFAYPVPFSPVSQSYVYFNYPMPQTGYVTIEIYDFAMNLVKTVVNNQPRQGGEDIAYSTDYWDGRNGRGDVVAAGIYYFKVETSNGDINWGKLAIIP
jgi:hypothetical protein